MKWNLFHWQKQKEKRTSAWEEAYFFPYKLQSKYRLSTYKTINPTLLFLWPL